MRSCDLSSGTGWPRRASDGHERVQVLPAGHRVLLAVVLAGAGLLAAACATGAATWPASAARQGSAHPPAVAGVPAAAPSRLPVQNPATPGGLAALAPRSVIYTASLTVRTRDVTAAAARAARIAQAAGGYVSAEHTMLSPGHPGHSRISIQLKIPVARYPAALAAVASLGSVRSETQQATDVTQAVADVASRVASARAAIAALRALLARAGTVNGLLAIQGQISQQESELEALEAQQRALARETAYATVSLLLSGIPAAAVGHHQQGFAAGLAAGWRALRTVAAGLLTALGAVLPFLVPVALAVLLGYRARRWRAHRRATPAK
jgi:hypothetical protein